MKLHSFLLSMCCIVTSFDSLTSANPFSVLKRRLTCDKAEFSCSCSVEEATAEPCTFCKSLKNSSNAVPQAVGELPPLLGIVAVGFGHPAGLELLKLG
jgi:hypothetical protein